MFLRRRRVGRHVRVQANLGEVLRQGRLATVSKDRLFRGDVVITFLVVRLIRRRSGQLTRLLNVSRIILYSCFEAMLTIRRRGNHINRIRNYRNYTCGIIKAQAICSIRLLVIPFRVVCHERRKVAMFLLCQGVIASYILYHSTSTALSGPTFGGRKFYRYYLAKAIVARGNGILGLIHLVCFRHIAVLEWYWDKQGLMVGARSTGGLTSLLGVLYGVRQPGTFFRCLHICCALLCV